MYTSASPYSFAVFLYVTSSNIMIFLLRVLNDLHKIAKVTFPWFNYDFLFKLPWHEKKTEFWDPQLTAWLVQWHHEQCHDKPHVRLHDRQHEWPHWQYHDRPKLWYQGSFAILPCLMCLLKTLAWWDEKSHWLHLEFFLFMTYSEKM